MKVIKNTSQQMDQLFKEARHDKPVMDLKEVEKIVNTGHYIPAVGVKGFHIGVNTAIVMSGIIVTSILTFMTLKMDKQSAPLKDSNPVREVVSASVPVQSTIQYSDNSKKPLVNQKSKKHVQESASIKKSDIERPNVNTDQSVASIDNSIVAVNSVAEQKDVISENNDLKSDNRSVSSISKKFLSGEFMIAFNYNDQEVEMKLNGEDITELEIDDKIITSDKYTDYDDLISEGRNLLAGKHSHPENNNLELFSYFDSLLMSDNIVASDSKYAFELTASQLLINKTVQSDEIFKKYKSLYETKTGKSIIGGSVYRYEKEVKSE